MTSFELEERLAQAIADSIPQAVQNGTLGSLAAVINAYCSLRDTNVGIGMFTKRAVPDEGAIIETED